jgi:hypothetical protein|tara:strand:+ start:1472 stop:1621 length:150 start_codon:yes stop_codon:yes gene_type:complete
MTETIMTLEFNLGEVLIMKNALVNFKKAPFVSKQETKVIDAILDRINDL